MPDVSVVLPTCDRPQLVGRALASLLAQTFRDIEIVLVDANRRTPPVTENPALGDMLRDSRVQVITAGATSNASETRNHGLRIARGHWVTFLDDDDEYLPEKIAAQRSLALATASPLVLCGYTFVWPRRRRVRQIDRERYCGDQLLTHAALYTPLLFHRRTTDLFFDEHVPVGHDLTYALDLLARHSLADVPNVPRALVTVYPQPAGTSVYSDKAAAWRGCQAAWKRAHRRFSRRACRALLAVGRLERAAAGHGTPAQFWRHMAEVARTCGLGKARFLAYCALTRFGRR